MAYATLVPIEKYRGHIEYADGHVHYLPISGWWVADCYRCSGPIRRVGERLWNRSHLRRFEAVDALAEHLGTFHGRC